MPLYEVTKTYYVWADSEMDAEYLTPSPIDATDTEVYEVTKTTPILANWVNAIPFGDRNDDKTVSQLRAEAN